ncbi:MAG: hypothetical protein HY343_08840 [Lentisphaerae bacterium]|nr:hypothetical protein [Lentisphaerota bacterium]
MRKATSSMKPESQAARRVVFQVNAPPQSEVFVAGAFNQWNATQNRLKEAKGNGKYSITLMLAKGVYEYKFIINGNWCVDPQCQNWVRNPFGTLNSLVNVE